jgi:hypothetical protein
MEPTGFDCQKHYPASGSEKIISVKRCLQRSLFIVTSNDISATAVESAHGSPPIRDHYHRLSPATENEGQDDASTTLRRQSGVESRL